MAYQSLYRRYRPQRFADVSGQEHLVTALRNAVAEDRVGHAYLFSGPRGTGKTTNARILAKALNCTNPTDGEPCCACESCLAIQAGTSFDLHELDAASHNGVGDIRDLIEKAALGTPGRTKVYILDEVHMLSTAAANALLKTLEEPPEHVVFVLATTDPQKVLPTIKSRTQHFEVHLLSADELTELVHKVAADAALEVTDEQVDYVVRKGAGSARDTLSALDQVLAAGDIPHGGESLDDLVAALVARDAGAVLAAVQAGVSAGREPRVIGELLLGRLRDAFLAAMGADLGHLAEADRSSAADTGPALGARPLTRALELLGDALIEMRQAPDPRVPLEVALIRIARPDADGSIESLVQRVEQLERSLAAGAAPAVPPGDGSPSPDRAPDGPSPAARPDPVATDDAAPARPADRARQVLADRTASRPSASPGARPSKAPDASTDRLPPAGEGAPSAARGAPRAALGAHRKDRGVEATAGGDGPSAPSVDRVDDGLPSRDELTLAWGDDVLDALPNQAKAFFKAGRFVGVSGGQAEFALPNKIHADRCEPHRASVEGALAAHFGRPIPLRLVVDEKPPAAAAPPPSDDPPDDPEPDPVEDVGPIDELPDAHDVDETHLARITAAFPGAEIVSDES